MSAALHKRGLKMIPNYSLGGRNYTDPQVLVIGNVTDGESPTVAGVPCASASASARRILLRVTVCFVFCFSFASRRTATADLVW